MSQGLFTCRETTTPLPLALKGRIHGKNHIGHTSRADLRQMFPRGFLSQNTFQAGSSLQNWRSMGASNTSGPAPRSDQSVYPLTQPDSIYNPPFSMSQYSCCSTGPGFCASQGLPVSLRFPSTAYALPMQPQSIWRLCYITGRLWKIFNLTLNFLQLRKAHCIDVWFSSMMAPHLSFMLLLLQKLQLPPLPPHCRVHPI